MQNDRESIGEFVLFGGSFDPPTKAHTELGLRVASAKRARLIVIPCASSPLKSEGPRASGEHRLTMTALAISASAGRSSPDGVVEVSRIEIDRASEHQASFFVDTLREFVVARAGSKRVWFVIGTDQAMQFHRWRKPREVLSLARAVVLTRHGHTKSTALDEMSRSGYWTEAELEEWGRSFFDHEPVDLSSTIARELLADPGTPRARLLGVLHGPVLEYIESRGLYSVSGRRV